MKEIYKKMLLLLFWGMVAAMLPSCGEDAPEEENELKVSPTSLSIMSESNSYVNLSIMTNGNWTISDIPEWLNFSANSGFGNTTVTVTSLSANNSDSNRSATITVSAGNAYETVTITQLASLVSNCVVNYKDVLALSNSVAFQFDISSGVSYFYAGFLDVSAAGWTDDRIVAQLTEDERFEPKGEDAADGIYGFGDMSANKEYYLCAVAFNSEGKRGTLTKQKVKTLKSETEVPFVTITDVRYNDEYWYWSTQKNVYTNKYYMFSDDDIMAIYYGLLCEDAQIAWILKRRIDAGNSKPLPNDGSWKMERTKDASDVFIATWGFDIDNNYSSKINRAFKSTPSKSKPTFRNMFDQPKKKFIPGDVVNHMLEHTEVYVRE